MSIRNRFQTFVVALGLFVCLGVSILHAQSFALPVSDMLIQGRLVFGDGSSAKFQVREGAMLTVRDDEQGYWLGFVPILNQAERQVNLTVVSISVTPSGGHAVEEMGSSLDVKLGGSARVPFLEKSGIRLEVTPQDLRQGQFSRTKLPNSKSLRPREYQRTFGASGGGLCVLTCGSKSIGANAVSMDCGVCEGEGASLDPG